MAESNHAIEMKTSFNSLLQNRGKRHFDICNEHTRWNFLMHHDQSPANSSFKAPQGLSQTKFSKGFFRRPLDKIRPNHNVANDEKQYARKKAQYEARRKTLLERSNQACNPLTNPRLEGRAFQKRHFSREPTPSQAKETLLRDRTSIYKFYTSDKTKTLHPNRNVKQMSSVIGYGREDMPSNGVLDNFCGHGYP